MSRYLLLFSSFGLLLLAACGDSRGTDTPPPPPPTGDGGVTPPPPMSVCGDTTRTGITDCLSDCNPGQWCDDTDGPRECKPGCTSDLNCGSTEYCDRPAGQAVGSCASCTGVTFGDPRASCVSPGRAGWSECLSDCAPGQFCNDTDGPRFCQPGCTSDANCGENDYCARGAGEAVGVCASCYDIGGTPPPPTGSNCTEACQLAGTICSTITPGMVGECVAVCPMVTAAEQAAIVACVDAAAGSANPCSVTECFGGPPTGNAACEMACEDGGFFCATGEVTPTQVATCKATCGTASPTQATQFINCIEAAFSNPGLCTEQECFDVFL